MNRENAAGDNAAGFRRLRLLIQRIFGKSATGKSDEDRIHTEFDRYSFEKQIGENYRLCREFLSRKPGTQLTDTEDDLVFLCAFLIDKWDRLHPAAVKKYYVLSAVFLGEFIRKTHGGRWVFESGTTPLLKEVGNAQLEVDPFRLAVITPAERDENRILVKYRSLARSAKKAPKPPKIDVKNSLQFFRQFADEQKFSLETPKIREGIEQMLAFYAGRPAARVARKLGDMLLFQWGRESDGERYCIDIIRQFSLPRNDEPFQLSFSMYVKCDSRFDAIRDGNMWCDERAGINGFRDALYKTEIYAAAGDMTADSHELTFIQC